MSTQWNFCIIILLCLCALTACSIGKTNYAPVVDAATIEHIPKSGAYHVMPGDTLYSIAWRYGLDYRYVASRNHVAPPYHIEIGQRLFLRGHAEKNTTPEVVASTHGKSNESVRSQPVFESNAPVKVWYRPARGRIIGMYNRFNKGINIAGRYGDPVYATAAGQVVYCGDGLRGYGNLIIIKHNNQFLTAYAHSSKVLVKQGDTVRARQRIAEIGDSGSRRVMLHFEIRRNGQPVNPLLYLR